MTLTERWNTLAEHPELHVCSMPETTWPTVHRVAAAMPDTGIVLDLGCGPGRIASRLADLRPDLAIVGADISPRMITQAPHRPTVTYLATDGETVPPLPAGRHYDGAYTILLFQHLDPDTVSRYLWQLGANLAPAAPLVVQFIVGDYHLDLDHRYRPWEIAMLAHDTGFDLDLLQVGAPGPDWGWLHAHRRDQR